jgi:hypothetical protein
MKRNIRILIACMALVTSAPTLANAFKDYFQANAVDIANAIRIKSTPKIYNSVDLEVDAVRLFEDGYVILGQSNFTGPKVDPKDAINFAKKIHSDIIIVKYRYTETVSGGTQVVMMPVIGGYGGMIGGAHPVSFDRYEQTALFFAKLAPEKIGLGLRWDPLTPQQVAATGSAKGISVHAVIRG